MAEQAFGANKKKLWLFITAAVLVAAALVTKNTVESAGPEQRVIATYARGVLHLTIPFRAIAGAGQLTVEVLDPDDRVLGRTEKHLELASGSGQWTGQGDFIRRRHF